jgi:hypothetical protein
VLAFLRGAASPGGNFDAFRDFGLNSLGRFFGAEGGSAELRLETMNFGGLTADLLESDWADLIPATVFDLGGTDPSAPPRYLGRCAVATGTDLAGINLAMPPAVLIDCLKAELRDFLVQNSLQHLLDDEAVPIHAVHGTADNLVPYQQSLELCGAIDGRVLPEDVVDPLTSYRCGRASQVQIVAGAGHALELGVCLDSLCPAGVPGDATREAVSAAMQAGYSWLVEDPPPPAEPPPPPTPDIVVDPGQDGGSGSINWLMLLAGGLILCWRRYRTAAKCGDPYVRV